MSTNHHEHNPAATPITGFGRPLKVALGTIAVIGGFYLLREHWNHVTGNWILLLLLACPLMHVFMHRGHGGHGGGHAQHTRPPESQATPQRSDKSGGPP